ncbi:MAG TPA: bile acid:sodium symporter family protein [Ideonella sp.]|uniref:bile acid:sodium symporter family protein n=1 Tax=Ideonella sp. TaxID=1929293 RepID=UPI002E35A429|nr:bile acid:sodium symporter family protein [Ideonella sp.]HEX5684339.1 bile acid:sodium symporter family protein [Ideonella sp.]
MQSDALSGVLLPLALAFIMFSLGLGLGVDDFRRILRQPKALLVGAVCHFVLLPLVAYLLIRATGLTGAFAVGFMIVAACPTGSTSNLLTYVARGDVALAVSFTAVASVLTIFTLPVILSWALQELAGTTRSIEVPIGSIMAHTFLMLGVPVALGMLFRHRAPARAMAFEARATRIATGLFVLIVVGAVVKNWRLLVDGFAVLAPVALTLNVAMLLIGFGAAWAARLPQRQAITLGIESSVQNATLALVMASAVLKEDAMAVPGAVYGVLMYAGGLAFAFGMRRFTGTQLPQPGQASSATT